MKTILSTLIFVLFTSLNLSFAQTLQQFLPANPTAIVHIKPAVLQAKVNMSELESLEIVHTMMDGVKSMIPSVSNSQDEFNLSALGIDTNRDMYFYANSEEGGMVTALVVNLTDGAKLEQNVKELNYKAKSIADSQFKTFANNDQFISIGNGMAILGMLSKDPEPFDPYAGMDWEVEEREDWEEEEVEVMEEEIEEAVEDEMPEFEDHDIEEDEEIVEVPESLNRYQNESPALNQEWLDKNLMKSILPTGGLSLSKKAKLAKGKGVMTAWVDYGEMMSSISSMAGMDMIAGGMMEDLYGNMYKGMDAYMDLQFNDGEMVIESEYGYPKSLTRGLDLTDAKVNPKFRKYIKGDNLLGVYSMALNPEAYGNIVKETMLSVMDGMPETMGLGRDLAPLLGVIIDEQAIYNFFKGDMVVAFTGINSFEKTVTTYEYDEDFNPIEKESTVESKIPEFTAMMTIGDRTNMQRILNIGKKMGVMESYGKYFQVMAPIGFDLFMAIENDILLISNDAQLITHNLSTGYANKVGGEEWKKIKKSSMHLFWNLPQTMNMASEFGFPLGEEVVNMSQESIKEITWTTPRKQGSNMASTMKMSFVNGKENSLKLILKFFNDMFFAGNSRTSM